MLEIRTRSLGETTELYLTARPGADGASALFLEIADALRARAARIFLERIFIQGEDPAGLEGIRRRAYGRLDDGVSPTWLASPAGRGGSLAGVLVHAFAGNAVPDPAGPHARAVRHPRGGLLAISGLSQGDGPSFEVGASALFAEAARLLRAGGADGFERCARTWLWVDPIGEHYGGLNRARTRVFRETGLISGTAAGYLPASTGIGLRGGGGLCLEAVAAIDGPAPTAWPGGGNQNPAFAYGSAFSRAARLEGPAGPSVFVSGTAAIGPDGATIAPGEIRGQIAATVENLRALLGEIGLVESEIAQGVVYVESRAVAEAWRELAPRWPHCVVLADICRPDLCFELEVTLWPGATPCEAGRGPDSLLP